MLKRDNRFGTIASDAKRRDLTINTLFYSPSKAMVYDFVVVLRTFAQVGSDYRTNR